MKLFIIQKLRKNDNDNPDPIRIPIELGGFEMTIEPENAFAIVVDDDHIHLDILHFMLRRIGIKHVEAFSNSHDAFNRIKEKSPDLIVSDWNMDPINGLQLLSMVRMKKQTSKIPFIMATANISEEYWKRAIEAGVTDFLFKPLDFKVFRGAVLETLRHGPCNGLRQTARILAKIRTP